MAETLAEVQKQEVHGHDHDHVYLHHGDPTEEERRLYHDLRGHQRRRHHRLRSML